MTNIRLIGLMLFITTVVLALAAAATRTTHIRISKPWLGMPEPAADDAVGADLEPIVVEGIPSGNDRERDRHAGHPVVSFTEVPIYWPLIALCGAGLLLWFMQPLPQQSSRGRKRSSRRHSPQRTGSKKHRR